MSLLDLPYTWYKIISLHHFYLETTTYYIDNQYTSMILLILNLHFQSQSKSNRCKVYEISVYTDHPMVKSVVSVSFASSSVPQGNLLWLYLIGSLISYHIHDTIPSCPTILSCLLLFGSLQFLSKEFLHYRDRSGLPTHFLVYPFPLTLWIKSLSDVFSDLHFSLVIYLYNSHFLIVLYSVPEHIVRVQCVSRNILYESSNPKLRLESDPKGVTIGIKPNQLVFRYFGFIIQTIHSLTNLYWNKKDYQYYVCLMIEIWYYRFE